MAPSLAKDGSMAFLNSRTRRVLLVYELATGKMETILSDPGILWAPSFSPDGREVAYARGEPGGAWHLWTIPLHGGTPRQLTNGKQPEIYARYSPDGQEIYFMTWGPEPLSLERIPRKGGTGRPLDPKVKYSDSFGDVSQDGKWIVFERTENKKSHLYVRAADGSGEARRLANLEGTVPRWSPDGKWVAFSPDRGFDDGVFIVKSDGTGLKRISERGGWPVWWPDGQKLGMQTISPEGNTEITVVTLSTGESRVLPGFHFSGDNFPFDVSRDGKWLITTNSVDEEDEIWLLESQKK
jgi:TolB protein